MSACIFTCVRVHMQICIIISTAAGATIVGVPGWASKRDSGQSTENNASESARTGDGRERRERGGGDLLVHNAGLVDGGGRRYRTSGTEPEVMARYSPVVRLELSP